jgi:aldose 1-epimerase
MMKIGLKTALVLFCWAFYACSPSEKGTTDNQEAASAPNISEDAYGNIPDKGEVRRYTLYNAQGTAVSIINYGALIESIKVADRDGSMDEITLGFDELEGYLGSHPNFGLTVGRYANRIKDAQFVIDGQSYPLQANDGDNQLHGGSEGFGQQLWTARVIEDATPPKLELRYFSKDGEMGFPGNLEAVVTYSLNNDNELYVEFEATTDKTTHVNMTNHTYFNLNGGQENVLNHEMKIFADQYTPVDEELIPTGELKAVEGTPFNFRQMKPIGKHISETGAGYDHNFVLNGEAGQLHPVAEVYDPATGRTLEMSTTDPGVQFYTGNFLNGNITGKRNINYKQHWGFCLETQKFPDTPNHPEWPTSLLQPGEKYRHVVVYTFGVKQ